MDAFTVVAGQVHAAPEGNGAHIGGAVRLNQIQIHLGGGRQGNGVEGVKLQLGGIPLTAGEGAALEGAQIWIFPVAGTEHHVALDAAGLVEGQQAVAVGGGRYFFPIAVGIGEGGLLCRGHLEQVEFLPQGVYIYLHTVGHAGGGVGSGDGDIFDVIGGGDGHLGLGYIGFIGEILNVVPQAALAVVDAHRLGVVGNPLDAVAEAAPVVGVSIDADVLDEAQLLAQGQDVFALGRQRAADLGLIAQVDGFPILAVVQDLQCTAAVDPQHQRVGAGGEVGTGGDRILRKGNGIGVVETVGHRQGLESDCAAAIGHGGAGQAAAGNVLSVCRAVGHPLDGQGTGSAVIADGTVEGELFNVRDRGLGRREAHLGGRREYGDGGGVVPLLGAGHADLHGVLALRIAHRQVFWRDDEGCDLCFAVCRVFHRVDLGGAGGICTRVQLDGEGDILLRIERKDVGVPCHRCGAAGLNQGFLGILGDSQIQLITGGDGEFFGIGIFVVVGVIRRAVVRRIAEADGAGYRLQLDLAFLGNVSHFRVIAAPGAGFVGSV